MGVSGHLCEAEALTEAVAETLLLLQQTEQAILFPTIIFNT